MSDAPAKLTQQAIAAYRRDDLDEAELCCRNALAADADDFDAQAMLAVIAGRRGRHEEALAGFDRVLSIRPDDPPMLVNRGVTLNALGRFEEAVTVFDRVLAVRPDYVAAKSNREIARQAIGGKPAVRVANRPAPQFTLSNGQRITKRPLPFMLISTAHGAMITNRLDFQPPYSNEFFDTGVYEPFEVCSILDILEMRRRHYGDGLFAIDCGANIGVHTLEWSKLMTGWGRVLAIEAQERLYYALAGNIALNNCFNAQAINAAVGNTEGVISIPRIDFLRPARYGSVELKQRSGTEFIGQTYSYEPANLVQVRALRLDSLPLARLDLVKIDVEGMEVETLEGAANQLAQHKPILIVEIIKSDQTRLAAILQGLGYNIFRFGRLDLLAVHNADRALPEITQRDWATETI